MELRSVDVAILGAGTAGLSARREVEKAGKTSVIVEAGAYGTTCARVGCMPSKLLIAAADAAHAVERAPIFGVSAERRIDAAAVMTRVRKERDRFVDGVLRSMDHIPESERIEGCARFLDATTLEVEGHTRIEARAFVIATGSDPFVPPAFESIRDRIDLSDDVFEWRDLPRSVAVIGTGIIALELGQALHRLGAGVVFLNPFEEVGVFTDPVVRAKARAILSEELELYCGIEDVRTAADGDGVHIAFTHDGEAHQRTFERVVVAAGRRPRLDLNLEATGLALDAKGRPPWDPRTCQCGDAPIFVAGDASGHRPLLHEASDEGHIAGANAALFPNVIAHVRRTRLAVAFTDPQMALVGARHADLDHAEAEIGEIDYENQGRARVMARNAGIVRLYGQRSTGCLLGAELFAPDAEHLAHLLAWAVQRHMTVEDCLSMPFYHPVLEEGLRTGLRDLGRKLEILGGCRGEDLPDCPGA